MSDHKAERLLESEREIARIKAQLRGGPAPGPLEPDRDVEVRNLHRTPEEDRKLWDQLEALEREEADLFRQP
jgi:hypothetical protein